MKYLLFSIFSLIHFFSFAENGYDLWLRYPAIQEPALLESYKKQFTGIYLPENATSSATLRIIKEELNKGFTGLLQVHVPVVKTSNKEGILIIGTPKTSATVAQLTTKKELVNLASEGYIIKTTIKNGKNNTIIAANTDIALLYGCYHFLRLLQTGKPVTNINITSLPKIKLRALNHWDNLDRTVERGYAGFSLWNWHTLPDYTDPRYIDYARANASVGINATVLTNVNANATILTMPYLEKVKALADVYRPYGIKVFLTARFSAPIELGKLKTADPMNYEVKKWWKEKIKEIYSVIPDFGGFLVKANSEGQPGPQDYQRSHADGANMLADAITPYNGVIMWRAFVYSAENADDRHKQAYDEFVPLDGKFKSNVLLQVKNGAIDFMPREPFHPLFGATPKTPVMMEFQLTQEYLGQATNLVYLAPLFKEVLDSDTYQKGKESSVAKVIDGSIHNHTLTGIAGVSNIGNDINWTGHPMAQSNWYAFGRLAWDHSLKSETIAEEWLRMTFSNNKSFITAAKKLLLDSRDIVVQFSNPLGLHHIMGTNHHYGPAPWVDNLNRPEWNPVYYHKASNTGIGFDRTATGSNAIQQYHPDARKQWETPALCPDKYLLWFHHLPWNYTMKSGKSLWEELCYQYYTGAEKVQKMQQEWRALAPYVDSQRFQQITMLLQIQANEAVWWRNSCLLYFQTFSKQPIPKEYEQPKQTLEYYQSLQFPYAPGI